MCFKANSCKLQMSRMEHVLSATVDIKGDVRTNMSIQVQQHTHNAALAKSTTC